MTRLARQQKIILDYGEGPNLLEKALTGLSEANLDISPLDDGWTIRKIVHHAFIKQAIGNPGSEFNLQWYWQIPQDEWAELWNYERRTIETPLAIGGRELFTNSMAERW
jgi:hypothetical protein